MSKIPKISQVLVDKIVEMYKEGVPAKHIADALRLDEVTVHKYLTLTGTRVVPEEVSIRSAKRVGTALDKEIIELHTAGFPIKDIIKELNISPDTLYRHTRRLGLTRTLPEGTYDEPMRLIIEQKKSVPEVAKLTGFSQSTLYRLAKKYRDTGSI